jgi:uncharacterized membrane protein
MNRRWIAPLVIVAMFAFSFAVVGHLPDQVATHWGLDGEPDGWMGPWGAAFSVPLITVALWALLLGLPRIDPRKENYLRFWPTYQLLVAGVVVFMAFVQMMIIAPALGWRIDVTRSVLVVTGGLFLLIGNYLPRIRSNWWMGIRTPWTLSNEQVWRETHRLGGRTMMAGGAIAILAGLLAPAVALPVGIAGMLAGGLLPAAWSYILWRRLPAPER